MNKPKLLYHREARKFINMIKAEMLFTIITDVPHYCGEMNLRFYMSIEGKYVYDSECWPMFAHIDTFNTLWKHKHVPDDKIMLYRSNGVCIQLITHRIGGGDGDINYGLCAGRQKRIFNVKGGWTGTASLLRKHTSMEVIGVFIDDNTCYIHKEIADVIAPMVGLKVGVSEHYGNPKENEIAYAFTKA